MKTKSLAVFFAVLLVLGLALALLVGRKPRPEVVIPLQSIESPAAYALKVHEQIQKQIKQTPILVLGYQAEHPEQFEVVRALLQNIQATDSKFDTWIAEDKLDLPELWQVPEKVQMSGDLGPIGLGLKQGLEQGRRILVLVPSVFSSPLISTNLADQLDRRFHLPVLTVTLAELPRTREDEKSVTIPCAMPDADSIGTGVLGCAILQAGRSTYRKPTSPNSRIGFMDQRSPSDFLVFYSTH